MTEEASTPQYRSLSAIRARKKQLQKQIGGSEKKIRGQWKSLFNEPKHKMPKTPTQKFMSLATNSMGVIDGVILGWKLYRKLKK